MAEFKVGDIVRCAYSDVNRKEVGMLLSVTTSVGTEILWAVQVKINAADGIYIYEYWKESWLIALTPVEALACSGYFDV